MRITLLLFVLACNNIMKADLEPLRFYEFVVYTKDGDSIKGFSRNSIFMYVDSVVLPKNSEHENPNGIVRDTIDFWLNRTAYDFYPKKRGDTSDILKLYRHYNPIKIASSDILYTKEIDYFSSTSFYDLDAPLFESDSSWSNSIPDTIIELPYDEMFTYHYCIHDYYGENHAFFEKLANYAAECRQEMEIYFQNIPEEEVSEDEQIKKEKEREKRWQELKLIIEKIKTMDKLVVAYSGSC